MVVASGLSICKTFRTPLDILPFFHYFSLFLTCSLWKRYALYAFSSPRHDFISHLYSNIKFVISTHMQIMTFQCQLCIPITRLKSTRKHLPRFFWQAKQLNDTSSNIYWNCTTWSISWFYFIAVCENIPCIHYFIYPIIYSQHELCVSYSLPTSHTNYSIK